MPLPNLKDLFEQTAQNIRIVKSGDFTLTSRLKSDLAGAITGIEFKKTSARRTGSPTVSIPIDWFFIGAHLIPLYKALIEYKSVITRSRNPSLNEAMHDARGLTPTPTLSSSINNLEGLNEDERRYLASFLTDYDWWGGSKTIDRGDFHVSPLLKAADMLAASSNYLAETIVPSIASNPSLVDLLLQSFEEPIEGDVFSAQLLNSFVSSLRTTGFICSHESTQSELAKSYVKSIATKPLTILTGNSGTGKSKIAEIFAHWLADANGFNSLLCPVGADWTDNRNVLGFVNHLRAPEGQPLYESTPILELILRARNDDTLPYFLILDEMNLSHVERYFADFLSAMESGQPIPLHTSETPLKSPCGTDVPDTLTLPDNLFITGTVNVDETTYMFSPKVLDRANVIEFRVTKDDATAFLARGAGGLDDISAAPDGAAQAFLTLSRKARLKPQPDLAFFSGTALAATRKTIADTLTELFEIMHRHRMEFGYRTMHEVLRYTGVDFELSASREEWSWEACLDVQILQKILPKLNGSKKRIEPLLVDLALFCDTGTAPADKDVYARKPRTATGDVDPVKFRSSYEKLADMIEIVRRDQFVSFI